MNGTHDELNEMEVRTLKRLKHLGEITWQTKASVWEALVLEQLALKGHVLAIESGMERTWRPKDL